MKATCMTATCRTVPSCGSKIPNADKPRLSARRDGEEGSLDIAYVSQTKFLDRASSGCLQKHCISMFSVTEAEYMQSSTMRVILRAKNLERARQALKALNNLAEAVGSSAYPLYVVVDP